MIWSLRSEADSFGHPDKDFKTMTSEFNAVPIRLDAANCCPSFFFLDENSNATNFWEMLHNLDLNLIRGIL